MYKLLSYKGVVDNGVIKNTKTGAFIPCEESNPMYQEYLAWLAEGNEPLPADPE